MQRDWVRHVTRGYVLGQTWCLQSLKSCAPLQGVKGKQTIMCTRAESLGAMNGKRGGCDLVGHADVLKVQALLMTLVARRLTSGFGTAWFGWCMAGVPQCTDLSTAWAHV
jgi:hypothetical protein